jgi:hypothetical protein
MRVANENTQEKKERKSKPRLYVVLAHLDNERGWDLLVDENGETILVEGYRVGDVVESLLHDGTLSADPKGTTPPLCVLPASKWQPRVWTVEVTQKVRAR